MRCATVCISRIYVHRYMRIEVQASFSLEITARSLVSLLARATRWTFTFWDRDERYTNSIPVAYTFPTGAAVDSCRKVSQVLNRSVRVALGRLQRELLSSEVSLYLFTLCLPLQWRHEKLLGPCYSFSNTRCMYRRWNYPFYIHTLLIRYVLVYGWCTLRKWQKRKWRWRLAFSVSIALGNTWENPGSLEKRESQDYKWALEISYLLQSWLLRSWLNPRPRSRPDPTVRTFGPLRHLRDDQLEPYDRLKQI